ncbi:MAG: hypothetical protein IJA31_03065 [Clostridia bacterium]|nr:hypothetical protein [Clostridia bacterium]
MENLFLQILNMSITASWIVLAVCVLRLILKKAPKWVNVALWGLVAFRLVCPFSFESVLSLLPSAQTVPTDITMTAEPVIHSGIPALNSTINPILSDSFAPNPGDSANPLQIVTFVAAALWIAGMVGMLLYAAISFLRLHKKTKESIVLEGNVFVCDRIDTPFILGLFRPRIFLPSDMVESDVNHVLAHENAHLARRDHWWKPLGFLLLTVHWFNPVLWAGYVLLCRDIELACDEKVIRNMDIQNKKDYSSALINCSVSRKSIAACPLAFGEVGVKNRIKTVLHYKKPTLWILIAAVILCCIAAVCLLTNPVSKEIGGYEYRVSRYYYDNVIGAVRANRELGEYTYEIDENLSTVRYINGNFHCHYTLVPVADGTEKLIAAVESTLPAYYKLLNARQVYFREGWDGALREQSELNYFIIQYSDGSLIGGYIGAYDEVPGQIYRLSRTQKLPEAVMQDIAVEVWFDYVGRDSYDWGSVLRYEHPSFPDTVFEWKEGQIYAVQNGEEELLIRGMPVLNAVFCDLTGDSLPELCTTVAFGSGMIDYRIIVYDFAAQNEYALQDRGKFDYWLRVEDGQLVANRSFYPKESAPATEKGWLLLQEAENEYTLIFSFLKEAEKPLAQTEQLTLQDVVSLSQKGAALTWSDFEKYDCVETGSGLYIRIYKIDEMFTLQIGGGSTSDTVKPMYIYLTAADNSEPSRIDIRNADVQAFIDEHKTNPIIKKVTDFTWTSCNVVGNEKTFDAFCRQFGVPEKMQMSSQKYLPYTIIESVAQLQDFKSVMQEHMELDLKKQKGKHNSFTTLESRFDDAFFEENILLLFYADCESVYSQFSMYEMTESQGVLSIVFGERVPAWCEPEGNGYLFCVMLARTQAEKVSSYSATISAVYENQNEPQLPTEILLTEDMEWEFIHSGHIGIDVSIMKEISVDRTQNEHPVVRIKNEDELNSFVLCMGTSVGRMVENLNLNAYGNKRFDKTFFEKNDLILVYLYAADLQTAYSFAGCAQNGTSLDLYFVRANPQIVSHVTSGWLLTLAVPKSITQNVTDVACVVLNFKGYIEGSVKDFESLISGISTLKDVQSFAPNGEYLFLESGRGEPRVSTHFTADNYVVIVEYDEHNIVTRVTNRTY